MPNGIVSEKRMDGPASPRLFSVLVDSIVCTLESSVCTHSGVQVYRLEMQTLLSPVLDRGRRLLSLLPSPWTGVETDLSEALQRLERVHADPPATSPTSLSDIVRQCTQLTSAMAQLEYVLGLWTRREEEQERVETKWRALAKEARDSIPYSLLRLHQYNGNLWEDLQQANAQLRLTLTNNERRISEIQQMLDESQNKNEVLRNEITTLTRVNADQKIAMGKMEAQVVEEANRSKTENSGLRAQLTNLENEKQTKVRDLKGIIAELTREMHGTLESIADEQRKNAKLAKINAEQKAAMDKMEQLEETKKQLKGSNHKLEETKKQLKGSNHQLEETKKQLQYSKDQLMGSNQQLEETKKQLQESKQQLQDSKDQLMGSNQQLEGFKEQLEQTKKHLEKSKEEFTVLNQKHKETKEQLDEAVRVLTLIGHDHIDINVDGLKDRLKRVKGKFKGDKWTFTGEMMNGIPHGKGIVIFNEGNQYTEEIFIGNMYNGMIQGEGEMKNSYGHNWRSHWIDGKMEGYCEYAIFSGYIQKGYRKGWNEHGPVYIAYPNKSIKFSMWDNGEKTGHYMEMDREKKEVEVGQYVKGKDSGEKRIFTLDRIEMWDNGQCTNKNFK